MSDIQNTQEFDYKEWLRPIEDPDMGLSLLDLGLIYSVDVNAEGHAHCKMTLTSPACPAAGMLVEQVTARLKERPEIKEAIVELVWEPKWDPKLMASDEVKESLGIW